MRWNELLLIYFFELGTQRIEISAQLRSEFGCFTMKLVVGKSFILVSELIDMGKDIGCFFILAIRLGPKGFLEKIEHRFYIRNEDNGRSGRA